MTAMTDLGKSRLRFGPFEVDLTTRELSKSGTRIRLSGQPFAILAALLEHPGELVPREELRKRIWSEDTFVDFSHGLNAAVNKLREALCDSADEPRYIETLPRRGYRFIAPVEEATLDFPTAAAMQPVVSAKWVASTSEPVWKAPLEEEWQATIPVRRQTLVQLSALLAVIALLAGGIVGIWWSHWPAAPSPEEAELRLKQAAESLGHEAAERAIEQASGNPVISGPELATPSQLEDHSKSAAKPRGSSPEMSENDSILSRLAHSEGLPKFFRAGAFDGPAILRLDLSKGLNFGSVKPIVAGRDAIGGPQPSPDGRELVFMAGRNDAMDIWVCNADGSSPRQLTTLGRAGTPRWSPDSRWIAFDSDGRFGRSGIYVVSANGGPIRTLVEDQANNSVPSWSRDGKFIYFASNRSNGWSGDDRVWKVPAEGGQPFQITRQGGFSAYESMDGQTLYYAKSRYQSPEIWQVDVNGGAESRVSLLHPSTWASWTVTQKGILLLSEYNGQASELQYFDFASHSVHSLATLERASFWLSATASGSSIWYSELTDNQARQVFKAGLD